MPTSYTLFLALHPQSWLACPTVRSAGRYPLRPASSEWREAGVLYPHRTVACGRARVHAAAALHTGRIGRAPRRCHHSRAAIRGASPKQRPPPRSCPAARRHAASDGPSNARSKPTHTYAGGGSWAVRRQSHRDATATQYRGPPALLFSEAERLLMPSTKRHTCAPATSMLVL